MQLLVLFKKLQYRGDLFLPLMRLKLSLLRSAVCFLNLIGLTEIIHYF